MKRIALKIDADTCLGTLTGVPALTALLKKHEAQGSFFFSLGPDSSGRQNTTDSLKRFYGLKTRLYGRLLPSPDIGKRCRDILCQTHEAGFETGIHAWNRVAWEERILDADNAWSKTQIEQAEKRFSELLSIRANAHAAAGWRSNRHALRLTQRLGFSYASDCRGSQPFIPVIDGEIVACPQIPTTLPTFDEILTLESSFTPEAVAEHILKLSIVIPGDHVFNLRAELEGMLFTSAFEHLLNGWKEAGFSLVALRDLRSSLEPAELPRHEVRFEEIPGRPGKRMIQGPSFP